MCALFVNIPQIKNTGILYQSYACTLSPAKLFCILSVYSIQASVDFFVSRCVHTVVGRESSILGQGVYRVTHTCTHSLQNFSVYFLYTRYSDVSIFVCTMSTSKSDIVNFDMSTLTLHFYNFVFFQCHHGKCTFTLLVFPPNTGIPRCVRPRTGTRKYRVIRAIYLSAYTVKITPKPSVRSVRYFTTFRGSGWYWVILSKLVFSQCQCWHVNFLSLQLCNVNFYNSQCWYRNVALLQCCTLRTHPHIRTFTRTRTRTRTPTRGQVTVHTRARTYARVCAHAYITRTRGVHNPI